LRLVPRHLRIFVWRCIRHAVWKLHGKIAIDKCLDRMCVSRELIGWDNRRRPGDLSVL
jgi:hypothetical protein